MAQADDSPASTPIGHDPTEPPSSSPAGSPPPDDSSSSPSPTAAGAPETPASAGIGGLIVTAVSVLACGLGIAFVIERYFAPPREPGPNSGAVEATASAIDAGARPAGSSEVARTADGRDLAERLDKLSRQVEAIQKQLDAQSHAGPPPEVAALQVRVADLTTSTNNLAPLLSKVDHLDSRINDLSNELNALRGDLTASQSRPIPTAPRGETPPGPPPHEPTTSPTPLPDAPRDTPPRPTPVVADPRTLAVVADLYRRGKYKDAREALNPITTRYPGDARVWYYAAMTTGFTTRDWAGAAAQLVRKGIAREEAGTPRTPDIDAEFKDLTTNNGKDWLAGYRKRVNAKKPG